MSKFKPGDIVTSRFFKGKGYDIIKEVLDWKTMPAANAYKSIGVKEDEGFYTFITYHNVLFDREIQEYDCYE